MHYCSSAIVACSCLPASDEGSHYERRILKVPVGFPTRARQSLNSSSALNPWVSSACVVGVCVQLRSQLPLASEVNLSSVLLEGLPLPLPTPR